MILRKPKENGVLPVDMTNFGASFKKARESKSISLDKIAAETRISTRFLTAIENEEFHLLPGGIFNRGFVRTYAERVGLDPDQAVADYERLAEAQEPSETIASARPTRAGRNLYPVAIGALALLIVIFYVVTRESGQTSETGSPAPAPAPPAVTQPAPPPQPTPPTTPPETTSAAPEPAPATAAKPQALTLELQANAQTWIKVTADGSTVNPGEILEPGTSRKFTAQNSINIAIGNAGGLTLKLNDQPVKPLGKSGQVRELTITPNNIKDFIG